MIIGSATVQANQLQGLRGFGGLGDCTEDANGNMACDNADDSPDTSGTAINGNSGTTTVVGGVSNSTSSTNWGNLLANIFGDAASVASTALRSSTQTCQVVNGQTVCTTNTTGGALPVTGTSSLLGSSTSLYMFLGIGLIAIFALKGK